jgi:hypothetical protein
MARQASSSPPSAGRIGILGEPEPSADAAGGWPGRTLARVAGALFRPATLSSLVLLVGSAVPLSWLTSGPPFCPFKLATGLPCPGCGLTRAVVAALHGDPSTSFYFHPLGAPLVLALVVVAAVDGWVWWRTSRPGRVQAGPEWLLERLARTPAPWIAIGLLGLVWLARLPLYVAGAWVF